MDIPIRGGSLLHTPELVAKAIAQAGPEHVRTCTRCENLFFSAKLASDICWSCWYAAQMENATTAFTPLSTELERLLEVKTTVDQTGGMTMCLRVPIGRPTGEYGETSRWAWFGELGHPDDIGMGLYDARGLGEEDDYPEGEYLYWPGKFFCGGSDCAWYKHPELSREVALWAAREIVKFSVRTGES